MRAAMICLAKILEQTGRSGEAFTRMNALTRQMPTDMLLRAAIA